MKYHVVIKASQCTYIHKSIPQLSQCKLIKTVRWTLNNEVRNRIMSGFKSFSQKTTGNEGTKLAPTANEHSEVSSPTENQPEPTPNPEPETTDQPDPNNK